jgi:hypothetical protein
MIPVGNIVTRIQKMISDESSETKADIYSHLNSEYIAIGADHEWNILTLEEDLTTILPTDCVRLRYVQDGTDYLYFPIHAFDRYKSLRLYNWFQNIRVTTPLKTGSDGVIAANTAAFSTAAAGLNAIADPAGDYIRIGENVGFYKIKSRDSDTALTLEDGYEFRGASETAAYFEIRPEGTKQLALTNEDGNAITASATAKMWYLRQPLPLYNDWDMVKLPGDCDALRIGTLRRMMEQTKYDTDALRQIGDFDSAIARLRKIDDQTPVLPTPRDKYGNRMRFGRYRY